MEWLQTIFWVFNGYTNNLKTAKVRKYIHHFQ